MLSDGADRTLTIPVPGATLHARERGPATNPPIVALHGGPDLDQHSLWPGLALLAQTHRVVGYDQRGRGRSADGVTLDDVSLDSDLADLAAVCRHLSPTPVVLLGHSWGAMLALELALREPALVGALVLIDPAPLSQTGIASSRANWFRSPEAIEAERAARKNPAYAEGDPDAATARAAAYYAGAVGDPAHVPALIAHLGEGFAEQGASGIRLARAIEDRLISETWRRPDYDRIPALPAITTPTLVLTGALDPTIETAHAIAEAVPGAELVVLPGVGHFALAEAPEKATAAITAFLQG